MDKTEMETTKCKGCGADIVWANTESGRPIPLDAKSEKRFVVQVLHRRNDQVLATMVDTYITHFATCPKAADFRRDE